MNNKHLLFLAFYIFICFGCKTSLENQNSENQTTNHSIKVAFYNVENLFDAVDDPKTNDKDYLPDGYYHWTEERYQQKLINIASVINKLDADIIGLAEVENLAVLEDLVKKLSARKYKILHFESHDLRGIDNAILYSEKLNLMSAEDITARMPNNAFAGPRGIIQAVFEQEGKEFVVFVNHWPSRKSGKEDNRMAYSNTLLKAIKNLDQKNFLVLGDFNDTPLEPSLENLTKDKTINNPFKKLALDGKGTSVFKKEWFLFDQILYSNDLSPSAFGIVDLPEIKNSAKDKYPEFPLRTFTGNRYNAQGCSDHFPVYLELSIK